MICFEGVSKQFEQTKALWHISFRIDSGNLVFLTGESGSGKTTLLKLLLREYEPEQGRICVNGVYLDEIGRRQLPCYRRGIGMIWQDFKLIEDKSVYENVLLARRIAGAREKDAQRQVCAVLSGLGLAGRFRQYPEELSGGEKQKVCLARALVNRPGILLADEPTGNLDPGASKELFGLLEETSRRGVTVLVATHDIERAPAAARRVIRLEQGTMRKLESEVSCKPPVNPLY